MKDDTARPPQDAIEAAAEAIADGIVHNRTTGVIARGALGDAYPAIKRHVIEGLLEDVGTEISHRADDLADESDHGTAWALAEELEGLGAVRSWLQKQVKV